MLQWVSTECARWTEAIQKKQWNLLKASDWLERTVIAASSLFLSIVCPSPSAFDDIVCPNVGHPSASPEHHLNLAVIVAQQCVVSLPRIKNSSSISSPFHILCEHCACVTSQQWQRCYKNHELYKEDTHYLKQEQWLSMCSLCMCLLICM